MKVLLLIIIVSLSGAVSTASQQANNPNHQQFIHQMRNTQMIQTQNELAKVQNELNEKAQEKAEIEEQLEQMKSPQAVAKTMGMNSKVNQFSKAEKEMRHHLQQIELDIKNLKQKQISLTESLKK